MQLTTADSHINISPIKVRHQDSIETRYLIDSHFCDHNHSKIVALSKEISLKSVSDRDFVISSFYWVRDNIKYSVGMNGCKSSETLNSGEGSCSNKANLLVALLRANGISAGYRVIRVNTKKYFGPVIIERITKFLSNSSSHIFASVLLDGKWVDLDPSDDKALADNTFHINPQSRRVDFDGYSHALLNLEPSSILSDEGIRHSNIDDLFSKKANIPASLLKVFNRYADYLRENGKKFNSPERAGETFFNWLEDNVPKEYKEYTHWEDVISGRAKTTPFRPEVQKQPSLG